MLIIDYQVKKICYIQHKYTKHQLINMQLTELRHLVYACLYYYYL